TNEPAWAHSNGILRGVVFQFAEGRWTDEIGSGIAVNEEAFDQIVPFLLDFCSGWTPMHRYGVYEMPAEERLSLANSLARAASNSGVTEFQSELFDALADWLASHASPDLVVSILGI
ncbi:MAG: hypothetical protein RL481_882, partial [Pseudomonadota bacterium]